MKYPGIKDLGNGRWELRVYWTPPELYSNGESKQIERQKIVRASNLNDALRLKLDLEERLRSESEEKQSASGKHANFGAHASSWLKAQLARRLETDPMQAHLLPSTGQKYTSAVKFLTLAFGKLACKEITTDKVKAWRLTMLEAGYKRNYLNSNTTTLRLILKAAQVDLEGLSILNPKPDQQITRQQPNQLNGSEFDKFLDAAKQTYPQHYGLILVLFTTTLRIGTAIALRWEDCLPDEGIIVTSGRMSAGVRIGGRKGDRFGEETPPLLPEVWQVMLDGKTLFNAEQLASGLVFPNVLGDYRDRTCLKKPFATILKQAGIQKRFTPHGCRRTGARLYGRTAGTRLTMSIMGHSSETMSRHYQGQAEQAEKMVAAEKAFPRLVRVEKK